MTDNVPSRVIPKTYCSQRPRGPSSPFVPIELHSLRYALRFFTTVLTIIAIAPFPTRALQEKESKPEGGGPGWLDWLERHFGLTHAIEIFILVAGFPVVRYLAQRFWDKELRAPEGFWLTGWGLTSLWYFSLRYARSLTAHPYWALLIPLGLTAIWILLLGLTLHSDRGKLAADVQAASKLEDKSLYPAAIERYRRALANQALRQGSRRHLECLCQLGACFVHIGDRQSANRNFDECLSGAVAASNQYWQARALCGLGQLEYLGAATEAARNHYEQALAISASGHDQVGEAVARRYLGELEAFLSNFPAALDQYNQALSLFRSHHRDLGTADVLRSLGELEVASESDDNQARLYLDEARMLYQKKEHVAGIAAVELAFGQLERMLDNNEKAREHYRLARGRFQSMGNKLGQANVSLIVGEMDRIFGAIEAAEANFNEALVLFEAEGETEGQANCLRGLGHLAIVRGLPKEALETYTKALKLFRSQPDRLGEGNVLAGLANLDIISGDYAAARLKYQQAADLFQKEGSKSSLASLQRRVGDLETRLASFGKARERYTAAAEYQSKKATPDSSLLLLSIGRLECLSGNIVDASRLFRRALTDFTTLSHAFGRAASLGALADVELAESHSDSARRYYVDARAIFSQLGDVLGEHDLLVRLAELETLHGNHQIAADYLDIAKRAFDNLAYRQGQADVLGRRGQLAAASGDKPQAKRYLNDARALYQKLGLPLEEACINFLEGSLSEPKSAVMLRAALDSFRNLGAKSWAARAQSELDNLEAEPGPAS
jgi:tetratricopeptide (TPR) repeat protein